MRLNGNYSIYCWASKYIRMSKKTNEDKPFVEARELSLDDWLKAVVIPDKLRDIHLYPDFCFPSEAHRDEYMASIITRDHEEIISLLRVFLLPTLRVLGNDIDRIGYFLKNEPDKALKVEQVRRFIRGEPAWEGISWVIDLLHRPRLAINVIFAYLAAHFWWMPDWRINGLYDAMTVIRAAFLDPIHPKDELLLIAPRDFELLVALMFHRRDFNVIITQRSRDGGYDLKLNRIHSGAAESSVVECKRYTSNVGVKDLRALLGVVERDGATRGLLVTTADFTQAAKSEASQTNRIELIDYNKLSVLFNEDFGPDWLYRIECIISEARRKFEGNM